MTVASSNMRLGGRILADQLRIQGVDTVFGVPGESYLGLLDGLYEHRDAIRIVVTRHEGGAANMAEAYAKLTGRPGVCAVTRGPGATNASNGIHTAFQDSTPLIVLIGQVARDARDREAFQEIEYREMFAPMAKWVGEIPSAERVSEYVSRAFHVAQSGRPGPVVLALPEDMLLEPAVAADAPRARPLRPAPTGEQMAALRARLEAAKRPLVMAGGPTWTETATRNLQAFAEANDLPVAVSFRAQDRFDNRHQNYAGHAGIGFDLSLKARIEACDFLIVAGARLGEMTTLGYSLFGIPVAKQTLVHVHPDTDEIGRVYAPDLGIASGMEEFTAALVALEPVDSRPWAEWRSNSRADYLAFIEPTEMVGDVNLAHVVKHMSDVLDDDAIIANGSGNNTVWLHRFFQYKRFGTQVAATSGSMGYGVPAAVAAGLVHPDRTVISMNGDGCFLMLGQELATAAQYGSSPIILVVNNSMLATIRMHQERRFSGRVIATDLANPDFCALATAYGAHSECVRRTDEFPAAFERARGAGRAAVIEIVVDPESLNPRETISDLRAAAATG